MAGRQIRPVPITRQGFAPYGDLIDTDGEPDKIINAGLCGRYHDRANFDITGEDGRLGLSLFKAQIRTLPLELDLVERHPLGSQAFIPMSMTPFLVIVADDLDGKPGTPKAFITQPGQAINFARGTWHGVLTPLHEPGLFAVIDRIGTDKNLEEYHFPETFMVLPPA